MKRSVAVLLVLTFAASMFSVFSPLALGEIRALDMRVSNYSWYTSSLTFNFIVVGEVQNFETATVDSAIPRGVVYTKDGQAQATTEYAIIYTNRLLPDQKAPFYMEFTAASSVNGNLSWITLGIDRVDFSFFGTTTTDEPQDSGVQILAHTSSVDSSNNYNVTGILLNKGSSYPENVWVVAAFYNASGTVIAAGVSKYVTPHFLPPNQTAMFSLIPTDPTLQMATQITTYELQAYSSGSTTSPPPSTSASPSPSSSPTSAGQSPSPSVSPSQEITPSPEPEPSVTIPLSYIYATIAAIAIAVTIITLALVLRKRKKQNAH
jgi:hypothetical protein